MNAAGETYSGEPKPLRTASLEPHRLQDWTWPTKREALAHRHLNNHPERSKRKRTLSKQAGSSTTCEQRTAALGGCTAEQRSCPSHGSPPHSLFSLLRWATSLAYIVNTMADHLARIHGTEQDRCVSFRRCKGAPLSIPLLCCFLHSNLPIHV